MILERCGCALCVEVVLIGNIAWGACRVGVILGGTTELGMSLFFVTAC